jgi:hypothetical protein
VRRELAGLGGEGHGHVGLVRDGAKLAYGQQGARTFFVVFERASFFFEPGSAVAERFESASVEPGVGRSLVLERGRGAENFAPGNERGRRRLQCERLQRRRRRRSGGGGNASCGNLSPLERRGGRA